MAYLHSAGSYSAGSCRELKRDLHLIAMPAGKGRSEGETCCRLYPKLLPFYHKLAIAEQCAKAFLHFCWVHADMC